MLWWWCIDYALDGQLDRFSPAQIASAADFEGNPGEFVQALADSGFIDRDPLRIHDWLDFCGDLVKKRLEYRKEKRRRSNRLGKSLRKKEISQPTVPYRTVPNQTKRESAAAPQALAPDTPYKRPDPKTEPLKTLVFAYKIKKGFPPEDRQWDQDEWPRASKPAKAILSAFAGDLRAAVNCLEALADRFDARQLDWTLETIEKHCREWKLKNGGYQHGAVGRERVFSDFAKSGSARKIETGGGFVSTGEMLTGKRDLPTVPAGSGGSEGLSPPDHGGRLEDMGEVELEKESNRGWEP